MRCVFVCEFLSVTGRPHAALLAAGMAMRDAMVRDLLALPGVAVTCAVRRGDIGSLTSPRLSTAAAQADETIEGFVQRMASRHDACWIVAPETGGTLSRLRDAVGDARWIGCSAEAIRIASSKRATVAALASRGIQTPHAFVAQHRGRWIVKPDDGAGAVDTRVHGSREAAQIDLDQRDRRGVAATLEPFVEGEALSVSLLAGADGAQAIAFNRQCIEIDAGGLVADMGVRHHALDPRRDPRVAGLRSLALDVADALPGLRGFVGVDVVWSAEHGPVAIEVNPRLTSAYVGLSDKLQRNLAADVLSLHAWPETRNAAAA